MFTKKVSLVIAAIAMAGALAWAASDTKEKPTTAIVLLTNVTFMYVPPTASDYSDASVKDIANWQPGNPGCSNQDVRACTIDVPQSATTDNGTKLATSVAISTSTADFANYYVTGGANIASHINKD